VVTELPYQVNKAGWIEKVADLVNQGRLQGIADLRDESDRQGMRVVIELKRDTNPQEVLHNLYHQTALQSNFGAILLALVDGQPRQLTLRQLLEEFLSFREQTLNRRYSYELAKVQSRLHLVEGLLKALSHLDEVVEILRSAADGTTAKMSLQNQLDLNEVQADAILAMPLRRLTNLEHQNLHKEYEQLNEQIQALQRLLNDRRELLKSLKKDLRSLKRKYNDARRTKIIGENKSTGAQEQTESPKLKIENPLLEVPSEEVVLEFTHRGYVRRQPSARKARADNGTSDNDTVIQTVLTDTAKELLVLTSGGKIYPVNVADIPPTNGRSARGTPLITLLSNSAQGAQEAVINRFVLPEHPENNEMVLLTKQGRIKRFSLTELTNLTRRGITILKLKDGDELLSTQFTKAGEHLVLASSGGRVLKFEVNDHQLPVMGRTAMGLQGLRVRQQEEMVGFVTSSMKENLLLVTQLGYAKRIPVSALRSANRGDIGTQTFKFTNKSDILAGIVRATAGAEVALVTNHQRLVRLGVEIIPTLGKDVTGESILQLNREEKIICVVELHS
jgi:DNA gyrase subunit A